MSFRLESFTKQETQVLKGVGILLIVLHNFLHNLTPIIGENEFAFYSQHLVNFYQTLLANPFDLVRALFSYFGHYGVQIFVFFSAYGLTRKYHSKTIDFFPFLRDRFFKIYLSFLLCVAVYIILGLLKSAFLTNETVLYWDSLLFKVLLISNFMPNQALMPVGPWWFLPFIFQFYLLFPLLIKGLESYHGRFLLAVAFAGIMLQWFLHPFLTDVGLSLYVTVFGHLPVLCAGMYFAANDNLRICSIHLWSLLILFVLGNVNGYVWAFSGFAFAVLVFVFFKWVLNTHKLPRFILSSLLFFGGISLHLFMVNGFLRSPFHTIAEQYNLWWVDILAALVSLAFSTVFALLLRSLDNRMRGTLSLLKR